MVAVHGSKARLFLSGWDVSPNMTGASAPASVDVADVTGWGSTAKKYIPGAMIDGTLQGEGWWEAFGSGVPGSIDELLNTALGGSHVASYLPGGDGFGNRARIMGGIETSFEVDTPDDDKVGFSFELQASVGYAPAAKVLHTNLGTLNITAGGNGTSLDDLGAAGTTTRGLGAALQVTNKGGAAGTLTVKVQHSPDNSVWTDLITFGGKTVKNVAEYLEVTGTVQRYLRALWTVTGGTWDIHVAAGRK